MSMIEPEDLAKLEEKRMMNEPFQVEEIDTFQYDENGKQSDWKGYGVTLREDPANYCWLMRDKLEAESLCMFLNRDVVFNVNDGINSYVLDNCREWSSLIDKLSEAEKELYSKKESYEKESESLLEDAAALKAATGEDIIKAKYGGNNDKTRRRYVKDSLLDKKLEIKQLEFKLDYYKRRISYLK